ncbi:hypothetical protein JB92DRAFT_182509 [Gautieria morchelliformis]|nr:hypothetical protein JB92DRAFT_182509 [Gautieria morchelliformis]
MTSSLIYSSSLACPHPRQPEMPFPYLGPPTPPQESDHHDPVLDYPTTSSHVLMGRSEYHSFIQSRSRVIRIFNLPKDPASHLPSLFHPATPHTPLTLWSVREDYGGPPPGAEDSVWAVFKSHEQAAAALTLSGAQSRSPPPSSPTSSPSRNFASSNSGDIPLLTFSHHSTSPHHV